MALVHFSKGCYVATKYQYMKCDWYMDVPFSENITLSTTSSIIEDTLNNAIKELTNYTNNRVEQAIIATLSYSTVSALTAGISTGGPAAVAAFLSAFEIQIKTQLSAAYTDIEIKANSLITQLPQNALHVAFPGSQSRPYQSCGWTDWQ